MLKLFRLKSFSFILAIFFVLVLQSCNQLAKNATTQPALDSVKIDYARGFRIYYHANFKEIVVQNPWNTKISSTKYYLVKNKDVIVPADGQKILIPIKTIAATSVTHFEFIRLLGELTTISAVCSPQLIYNAEIRSRVLKGETADLGDAFQINFEKTMAVRPAIVMISGYNQHDPFSERLMQAGVPVVTNVEWMENSLLARAEWIKFIAAFYDKEAQAIKIFNQICTNYNRVKSLASNASVKPQIMAGNSFRGTWYVPAGRNFMAGLFADAGGSYFYAADTAVGSLPLQVETVIKNFNTADVWLNCNFNSLKDLISADSKHAYFQAYKTKNIYSFNNRLLKTTANDFWESAIARPDLLLSDVISILHPDLLPDYKFTYAKKLED